MIDGSQPPTQTIDDRSGRRQRLFATGLLLLAAVLFAATFLDPPTELLDFVLAEHYGGVAGWRHR